MNAEENIQDYYEPDEIIQWIHDWANGISEEDLELL